MKIFLSSLENGGYKKNGKYECLAYFFKEKGIKFKWNLMSFYYLKKDLEGANFIRDHSEEILIDSGCFSFQKGKKVDLVKYTEEYAEFIRKFDRPNVIGYFEMDVDNIIGYENVLKLRKILESVSNKIIPIWHKNRGIEEFKKMCKEYQGKIIAITGIHNGGDIKEEQYLMFLKYAKKYNCKVHCLGMTNKRIMDKVPFDYCDSSSWRHSALFGTDLSKKKKVTKEFSKIKRHYLSLRNYEIGIEMQRYYHKKWQQVCKD